MSTNTEEIQQMTDQPAASAAPSLAGASPAVPRDPRLLESERAEYEAKQAERELEEARRAAEAAAAKMAAAKANAERSRADLETAREEAKAKARAAARQVRLEQEAETQAVAEARQVARANREEQLGAVATYAEEDEQQAVAVAVYQRATDGAFPSLGLFLIRLVFAVFVGLVGWQALVDRPAVLEALAWVKVPEAWRSMVAIALAIGLLIISLLLVVGWATRVVSVLLLVGTAGFLAFFRFGAFSPLREGHFGFYGDREVFIAALCLLFIFLGAGGWSIDARMRHRRQRAEEEN